MYTWALSKTHLTRWQIPWSHCTNTRSNSSPKPYLYSVESEQSKETIPRAILAPREIRNHPFRHAPADPSAFPILVVDLYRSNRQSYPNVKRKTGQFHFHPLIQATKGLLKAICSRLVYCDTPG